MNHQDLVLLARDFADAFTGRKVKRLRAGLDFVFGDHPVHFFHVGGCWIIFEECAVASGGKRQNLGFHLWPPAGEKSGDLDSEGHNAPFRRVVNRHSTRTQRPHAFNTQMFVMSDERRTCFSHGESGRKVPALF